LGLLTESGNLSKSRRKTLMLKMGSLSSLRRDFRSSMKCSMKKAQTKNNKTLMKTLMRAMSKWLTRRK
jgi:hypothetical protein